MGVLIPLLARSIGTDEYLSSTQRLPSLVLFNKQVIQLSLFVRLWNEEVKVTGCAVGRRAVLSTHPFPG